MTLEEGAIDPRLIEATNELLGDIQDDSINNAPLPERVFHYTDGPGLLGILQSRSLWATDFRFLNDQSELTYTFDLAHRVLQEYADRDATGVEAPFLLAAAGERPSVYTETPYYLACFTELENSLSQWRAYSGAQGYSLEFPGDVGTMSPADAAHGQNPGISLLRVEYDLEVQRAYIRGLIDRLLTRVCPAEHLRSVPPEVAIRTFLPFYWAQLERVSYRFKHPDFAVEQEWRLVSWGEVHGEEYRAGQFGVTPYTRFRPASSQVTAAPLPIRSVRYGPTGTPGAATYALRRLLDRSGFTQCAALGSDTPVRL